MPYIQGVRSDEENASDTPEQLEGKKVLSEPILR